MNTEKEILLESLSQLRYKALFGEVSKRGEYLSQYLYSLKENEIDAKEVMNYIQQQTPMKPAKKPKKPAEI